MGAIGERKLQELIDRAAWEVANGTPQSIASRGLFEACAEVLEGKEVLETERDELTRRRYGRSGARETHCSVRTRTQATPARKT